MCLITLIGNVSPRSTTSSCTAPDDSCLDTEDSPRDTNATPTNEIDEDTVSGDDDDDPVVVPCNTQFMKITISDKPSSRLQDGEPADGKRSPVKPPRTNKPKTIQPPHEENNSFKQSPFYDSDDDSIVVDLESVYSDEGSQESFSESMRLELVHRELERLAPLQQRESLRSLHTSMSSYESVFDKDTHRQLDQLRPTSAPPYKVYKYEREKADYYDEYFYDDPEPKLQNADKEEVINVAEILEIRDALRKVKEDEQKAKMKPRGHQNGNISANLKQYMIKLPSTVITQNGPKQCLKHSKDGKGTRRYYVSHVEENEDEVLYSRPVKHKYKHDDQKKAEADNKVNTNKECETKNESINDAKSEKPTVTLKKHDWSFGYPRKTKTNSMNRNQELNDLNKPDKRSSVRSRTPQDIKDSEMEELLLKTGGLLSESQQLLTKRPRQRTANPPKHKNSQNSNIEFPQHKNSQNRNIEFANATEKCNHYLTNLILSGISNVIPDPSETSSNNTEDESVSTKYLTKMSKSKPEVDENENIKLSQGLPVQEVDSKNPASGTCSSCGDIRGITEFVVQYDYTPSEVTAMPVVRGEVLHIGLDQQEDSDWYWAYSPRLAAYGYVPKLYVRIPMVTII